MLVAQWDAVHPWPHGISDNLDLFNYYQSLYYYLYGIFIEFDDLQLVRKFVCFGYNAYKFDIHSCIILCHDGLMMQQNLYSTFCIGYLHKNF